MGFLKNSIMDRTSGKGIMVNPILPGLFEGGSACGGGGGGGKCPRPITLKLIKFVGVVEN